MFLKGNDPKSSFQNYHSVIRHPIRDVINSEGISIDRIEVYAFENNYVKREIKLNTTPAIYAKEDINLSPKGKSIDLDSIEEFLKLGVILEAVEVDSNNDLFFYGRSSKDRGIVDDTISISDLAVVYRIGILLWI